jgi:predicted DCC family thiol-disulfide oxidoreductase YuxK
MNVQTQKTTESEGQSAAACEVFFDGSCPLCRAEIGLYQRTGSDALFTDISKTDAAPPDEISQSEAMKRFHVRRSDGRLVSGAAAFAELWKATPGWRWLGRIAALPPFVWIGEGLYRVFLVIRPAIQTAVRRGG